MLPPNTYKVDDFETIRQTIFDDALNSLSNRFPLENDKYRLTVEDLGYDSIPKYTTLQQKEAVQSDKTLSAKIKGRWILYDKNTGKIVSQSSRKTIMDVPYMTERGTFIRNGTEMTLPIQMRLVPGVYARMTDSGEAKAHINVKPGSGSQLSITMNPANPVFKVTQGTRNYKLYPLLKHMGISDEYLMNAWGKDIYKANYDDFISGGGWYSAKTAAEENPYDEITKRVFRGDLDPLETEASLGKGYKTVDPDMMVAAASKLLRISKGEAESDNRDSLENQRFLMAPELIGERVRLDAGKVGQTLLWKISRSGDVNKIPAGALNKYINGLFTESRLAQAIEETNPLDAYMRATKVTRMGEGGISGVDTAPMSARLVHNTYKGFIDPTVSPECCANHLVMSNLGWVEISKVTEDTLVACLIDGKLEYHKPYKVVSYDFNGELYCYNATATAYEVTGNHRMWVCKIGRKARVHVDGGWRNEYKPQYKFEYAEEMHNTNRKLMAGGHGPLSHDIITSYTIGSGDTTITFDIGDWCEFLGWYIAEGCYNHTGNSKSVVAITQDYNVNKENCDLIRNLLTRMGVTFKYKGCDFKIKSRLIRREIEPLGYCYEKFIPEEVFMAPESAQLRFIDAILRGDGRKPRGNENAVLCTTSKRLAEDYERLLFNLGFATSVKFEKDDRESRYLGCYTIRHIANNDIWLRKNGTLSSKGKRQYPYFKKPYVGKVYCLSVPGGLFYTKLPGKRPFWIGNSLRAGLDSAIALNAVKGKDGFMYTPMINAISGRREYVNSLVASKVPVAFSEYRDSTQKYIPAMVGNKIEYLPKANVKYFIPNGDSLFALSSNLIPLKSGIKAGRLLMAQKHQTQAVSLSSRMAPYVQTEHPGDNTISVEKSIGKLMGAVFSKGDGKVLSVTPDEMTVRYNDGTKETISLYNNYPLNRKSYYHNESRVKPGDIIKKGQVLASSNYTDENGVSALGTQLRTAWMPFKGENYLDAIIVSEDAAKKLSSEHLYHTGVDKDSTTTIDKNAYTSAFPTKFNKDQLATIDKDGIVKPGTTVKFGDPLILSYSKREATPGSLHRALVKDNVVTWEHEFPGYITDVVNSSKGVKVYTKAYLPLQTGDKLAARYANKGVTARVVPTSEMPIAADGKPIDVIFGPTGIVSRVNSAQLVEAMLGKVAAKTGKRYVLPGFMNENMVEFAKRELAQAGLTDREDLTDPTTGITIPQITVGNSYIVKMHHTAESKGGARATGAYTMDELPGGQGHDGSKLLGNLILGAIIGHGCFVGSTNILTDRGYMEIGNIVKRRLLVNVYSYNKETDSFEYRPVTNWFVYTVDDSEMWEIQTTLNDSPIRCTKDHKFYTPNGLIKASNLQCNDPVYVGDSTTISGPELSYVTKSAPYNRPDYDTSLVYDITVEHNHNFIAAGVLVSNSTEVLKDMKLVKGQKNTDFWRDFKLGRTPVMPSTPLIYEKFLASLQGAGINVHKEKNTTNIFALTNKDINDFAHAEVKNSDTYSANNMAPLPGGLFDPNIFGPNGTQWGYIKLDEPVLNPVMEDPIKLILGLTEADLEAVISGNKKLPNGLTGGLGLKKQLESINMKQAVQDALNDVKNATRTKRDKAVKKYRYLSSMLKHNASPADFMLDKIPVIPPRFRRISQSGDLTMVADANYLYRALMDNQQDVRDARNAGLPEDMVGSGNLKIYKAFKAITGLSDPEDRKLQEKQVSGLLKWVFGKGTPKAGAYQRNVVGGSLDVAGRNVITPNASFRLDEIGLPKKEAWTLYQDFVIRRLVQNGMDPLVATKEVTNKTKLAEDALRQVVSERPVLATRAPALHKYSIMAFRPRLVESETLQLNPAIQKPFNADHDGDSQVGRVIVRFKRNVDVPFKYRLDF